MAARTFSSPLVADDLYFVAPLFGPAGALPIDEDRVLTFIANAEELTDREAYDGAADMAVLLRTAHELFLDAQANSISPIAAAQVTATEAGYAGPISAESMGPLSRSFGASSSSAAFAQGGAAAFGDDPLGTTPWGQRLLGLRRSKVFGRGVF